jgi:hypothetical protein
MEMEWKQALELRDKQGDKLYIVEAGRLVSEHFFDLNSLGMIRLRESRYYRAELQLDEFMSALKELFPARAETDLEETKHIVSRLILEHG